MEERNKETYTKWFWENIEKLFEIKPGNFIYVDVSVFGDDDVVMAEESLTQMFIELHYPFKVVDSNSENIVAIFYIDELKDEFGKEIPYEQILEFKKRLWKDREYHQKRISELKKEIERLDKEIEKIEYSDKEQK